MRDTKIKVDPDKTKSLSFISEIISTRKMLCNLIKYMKYFEFINKSYLPTNKVCFFNLNIWAGDNYNISMEDILLYINLTKNFYINIVLNRIPQFQFELFIQMSLFPPH